MIHEELLAKVKDIPTTKAVVKLHKPVYVESLTGRTDLCCLDCNNLYPCPTIQAIEKELK